MSDLDLDDDEIIEEVSIDDCDDDHEDKVDDISGDNDAHMNRNELEIPTPSESTNVKGPLTAKKLKNFQDTMKKRGIIYIARIPPGMTPTTVRRYMTQFGKVHRVFLSPEDKNSAKKRRKSGGNRGKRYTQGWVEFERKKIAKAVAASLNNTQIGGRRRSNYYDDLWNIKYLKGFKWNHMTEEAAYAKAVRDSKIREEISQSRKESAFYMQKVQQSKAIQAMERRHSKKRSLESDGTATNNTNSTAANRSRKIRRSFRQRAAVSDSSALHDSVLQQVLPTSTPSSTS